MRSRDKRECGILLHISSLPSKYGIGSFGEEAYRFVDFLAHCGQQYWQILPLVPLGEANSPYKSVSCFAGEPLYIDIDLLVRDGLLNEDEVQYSVPVDNVDFDMVRAVKLPLIQRAAERFDTKRSDYLRFVKKNEFWLSSFALFSAIAEEYETENPAEFPDELRYRLPLALENFKMSYPQRIKYYQVIQFLFYRQYFALKEYAGKKGVKIIGDIPFYVSGESADVWKNPDCFCLGRDLTPARIAGVPPDIFSASGQLWGNPVYDWDFQRKTNYAWWRRRLEFCASLYDVLRIDHFRAFSSYYSMPYGAEDARGGTWESGPGMNFWKSMSSTIEGLDIVAEDLGGEEEAVLNLIKATGFPNMKILQFGFDKDLKNRFLPKNYDKNCVCYTGTHDNDTALGWYSSATSHERVMFNRLAPEIGRPVPLRMISMAMHSKARLVIIPMQDWLCLGTEARMNTPGTSTGNWSWRIKSDAITEDLVKTVRKFSKVRI